MWVIVQIRVVPKKSTAPDKKKLTQKNPHLENYTSTDNQPSSIPRACSGSFLKHGTVCLEMGCESMQLGLVLPLVVTLSCKVRFAKQATTMEATGRWCIRRRSFSYTSGLHTQESCPVAGLRSGLYGSRCREIGAHICASLHYPSFATPCVKGRN